MYGEAGYEVPKIVFWNLRDTKNSFPVTSNTPGVAMLSGFSSELMKAFLNGDIEDMTPTKIMMMVLEPYLELVKVHENDL